MSFISKIFKAIWAAVKRILRAIIEFIKKYWWIILLVVAIYFAPAISAWLTSVGAPGWLSGSFAWVGQTLTPYVTGTVDWLISGAKSLLGSAGSAFASLSFGQQAALALGATALLAPEETAEAITATTDAIGSAIDTVGGAVLSSVSSSPLFWIAGGLALWWFLSRDSSSSTPVVIQTRDQSDMEGLPNG